jgi:acetyl esterase/lipase
LEVPSSWFDAPNARSRQVAWLLTIGESDPSYDNSWVMADQLRAVGAAPIFRSYVGMVHESSVDVDRLSVEFFTFHDERTKADLGKERPKTWIQQPVPAVALEKMAFIGDSLDWKVLPNSPEVREAIAEDTRVYLPTESIAKLLGTLDEAVAP